MEHASPGRGANGLGGVKGNIRGHLEVFLKMGWANLFWKCRFHFWTRPCQRPLACRKVARRRYRQARRRRFSCRLTCCRLFLLGWLYLVKLCYSMACIVWNKFCRILDRDPQPCRGLNTMLRSGAGGSPATKRKRNEKAIQNDALTRLCNLLARRLRKRIKGPDNPTCQLLPTSSKRKVKMAWGKQQREKRW